MTDAPSPIVPGRAARPATFAAALLAFVAAGCAAAGTSGDATSTNAPVAATLVDQQATAETRALFANLRALAGTAVLFGHQDDLAYGYTWTGEDGRSDVKETAGAYPAVYGWDVARLERDAQANIDGVSFVRMRGWIQDAYARGGVITLSWHMDNPVSGGNSWDTTRAVGAVLPGGSRHLEFRRWLDRFATFAHSLRGPGRDGRAAPIPVIFRPYHEMTGNWFWWGGRNTTPDEYRALWRYTVSYVRDTLGVHNLLWAYSPNAAGDETAARYLEFYPGDAYVDVLGLDEYFWPPREGQGDPAAALASHLRHVVQLADARGKVAALTETGYESIPDSTWWTGTLLRAIDSDSLTRRIGWVLLWRNATQSTQHPRHFYAPYPGHASAADFRRFRESPLVRFEDEIPDLYRPPRR